MVRVALMRMESARSPFCLFAEVRVQTLEELFCEAVEEAKSKTGALWDGAWELISCKAWVGAKGSSAAMPPDDAMEVPSSMWGSLAEVVDSTHFAFMCRSSQGTRERRSASEAGLQTNAFSVMMAKIGRQRRRAGRLMLTNGASFRCAMRAV